MRSPVVIPSKVVHFSLLERLQALTPVCTLSSSGFSPDINYYHISFYLFNCANRCAVRLTLPGCSQIVRVIGNPKQTLLTYYSFKPLYRYRWVFQVGYSVTIRTKEYEVF